MHQERSELHLGEGLFLGGGAGVPGQRAPWRSSVHASPSQRRMVGWWGHATQIQGVRGAQKANSHCGGHAPWATLSHSCSQPMTRLHPGEGEPRGTGKLQRGRTELPTLQCPAGSSAFCLLLGQGPVRPQENPRQTRTHVGGVSRPLPAPLSLVPSRL